MPSLPALELRSARLHDVLTTQRRTDLPCMPGFLPRRAYGRFFQVWVLARPALPGHYVDHIRLATSTGQTRLMVVRAHNRCAGPCPNEPERVCVYEPSFRAHEPETCTYCLHCEIEPS